MTFAGSQAVEEYKKYKNFEDDVTEGAYGAFELGFMECKKKVAESFL